MTKDWADEVPHDVFENDQANRPAVISVERDDDDGPPYIEFFLDGRVRVFGQDLGTSIAARLAAEASIWASMNAPPERPVPVGACLQMRTADNVRAVSFLMPAQGHYEAPDRLWLVDGEMRKGPPTGVVGGLFGANMGSGRPRPVSAEVFWADLQRWAQAGLH